MNLYLRELFTFFNDKKTTIVLLSVVFFFVSAAPQIIFSQKKFSKTYPASKNVQLRLTNRTGTVTVVGWNRAEVKIVAEMETSDTSIEPQNLSGTISINLVKDNQGKNKVGYVNFLINVPYDSMVNIETVMGNLNVSNIRGALVRAHITTEGDITLTDIFSSSVSAENLIGDILFDGEVQSGGTYRFTSTRGNINLRVPFNSSFNFVATAPSTRNISLGSFNNPSMNFGDGRRVFGKVGGGSATLTVTNQRGSISFISR